MIDLLLCSHWSRRTGTNNRTAAWQRTLRFGRYSAKLPINKLSVTVYAAQSLPDYARFTQETLISHQLKKLVLVLLSKEII